MRFRVLAAIVLVGLLSSWTSAQTSSSPGLLESAKLGQVARAKELLSKGAEVNTVDLRGFTPLMWASAGGHLEVVRQLLESGAAVGRRANDGTTALMLASANGFMEIVQALLASGADVAAARGGVTARQLAVGRAHSDVASLLERSEALGARLLQAAVEGHDTLVRQLLSVGAPFNTTDGRGTTALMIAARNGDLGILQALLTRGADSSMRDSQGQTVFDWAETSPATGKYVGPFLSDRGLSKAALRAIVPIQPPQVTNSLRALADLLSKIPPGSGPMLLAQRRANSALSQLQALSKSWPAESPEDYRDNLAGGVSALRAALGSGDRERLAATVQSVAEDLEVKLEHCTRSGGKLGGSVTVRVRTLEGSTERKSWQVFYIPRVFEAAANASPDLFPQLSSPTEETLAPGRYVMWVRDPTSARLGERTVVKVGEGRNELLLDLPVPAALPR